MQPKITILTMIFILITVVGISGCAGVLEGLGDGGELERVDGIGRYFDGLSSRANAHILTLPERRFIRRIVIHPDPGAPIKGLDISVRSGNEQWKRIAQIKGRKESAVIINTAVGADTNLVVKSV